MSTIQVGFVGVGMMSQVAHIPAFQRASGAELTAIASSRPVLLGQVADRFGIARRYASHEELGRDPEVDLVMVVVPPELNPDICISLLEAGKHVICEKPVSLSSAAAQRMADAQKASGKQLLVGFMKRHDAGVQAAKAVVDRWLASGEAGALLYARAHAFIGGDWTGNIEGLMPVLTSDEPSSDKPADVIADCVPAQHAGMWGECYFHNHVHSHDMDLLAHFLGRDCSVSYADWSTATKLVVFDFGGVPATLETAKAGSNARWDEELKVYFEGGWVHVKLPPPLLINAPAQVEVYWMGERQEVCDVHAPYSWSFLRQAQNAVDVVAGTAEPICTIEDGVVQVRMTEATFGRV